MKLDAVTERFVKLERKFKEIEERQTVLEDEIASIIFLTTDGIKATAENQAILNVKIDKAFADVEKKFNEAKTAHKPAINSLKKEILDVEHKAGRELDRLRVVAEEAVSALDIEAFNSFKAAVKIALETQRKENLKDIQRLNTRVDKLKEKLMRDLKDVSSS